MTKRLEACDGAVAEGQAEGFGGSAQCVSVEG